MLLGLAACGDRTDPMLKVQSPAEHNCRAAVADASGSSQVTLIALTRTEEGAIAQIRSDRDGMLWTCRANLAGFVISVTPGAA